jgi:hypothetical protein
VVGVGAETSPASGHGGGRRRRPAADAARVAIQASSRSGSVNRRRGGFKVP